MGFRRGAGEPGIPPPRPCTPRTRSLPKVPRASSWCRPSAGREEALPVTATRPGTGMPQTVRLEGACRRRPLRESAVRPRRWHCSPTDPVPAAGWPPPLTTLGNFSPQRVSSGRTRCPTFVPPSAGQVAETLPVLSCRLSPRSHVGLTCPSSGHTWGRGFKSPTGIFTQLPNTEEGYFWESHTFCSSL